MAGKFWRNRHAWAAGILLSGLLWGLCGCGTENAAHAPGEQESALYHGSWAVPAEEAVAEDLSAPQGSWQIPLGERESISLSVPEDGEYILLLTYQVKGDIVLRTSLTAQVGEQSCTTQLFSVWRDVTKQYGTDRYGNQILPTQMTEKVPVDDYVRDQTGVDCQPFRFLLTKGEQTLTMESHNADLELSRIRLVRADSVPDYAKYRSALGEREAGKDKIVIQGENYSVKSDSSIRAASARNPSLDPYDYRYLLMCELDGDSCGEAGQKVEYAFAVETAGLYQLTFHYRQGEVEDIPVYRNIRVDGRSLFRELNSVAFPYTGRDYGNLTVAAEGEPVEIYLEEGIHTLLLETDATPLQEAAAGLSAVREELSAVGLEVKKLAGTKADSRRTWDVESYLPGVLERLESCKEQLQIIYDQLGTLQKEKPAAAIGIIQAINNLEQVLEEPNKMPGKLSLLSEGSGSAAQLISDQIDTLKFQGLWIDCMYLQSAPVEKAANAGFLARAASSVKRFFYALTLEEYTDNLDEVLQVWVNRPVEYTEVLQALADTDFTPKTGIRVQFSTIGNEQRIILSNATDLAPDVVLGLGPNVPFYLGIRGAVADLSKFPGFAETMEEYNPQSLTPYIYGDQVFGATETQEFYVLMYRKDILESLNIEVPKTWKDVEDLMPVLQRNSMNFYLQLSGWSGTKPLYSTAPFLMQAGGNLYGEDALTTGVNSQASLKGFEILTEMYQLYSVQPTVSSFYNSFRFGQIPMGICNFSDYMMVSRAAPEIAGKWAIAPAPGIEDEQGVIHNGTAGASAACAIMAASHKQEEGWKFLQWWLSSQVQIDFGNILQTTYGTLHSWNSANTVAFAQLNFPDADRRVILEQWSSMQEINRHPAMYAVERELSNAWQRVVENNVPVRVALDDAAANINREFERKLEEFGYLDENGNVQKPFVYVTAEEILKEAAHGSH